MERQAFLVEQATGKKIHLAQGKNTLGRGPFLGIEDKKLSRQQVDITLNADGTLRLLMTGTNPSFLRKSGSDEPILLKKGDEHPLADGDAVSLLVHDYAYRIVVPPPDEKPAAQKRKPEADLPRLSSDDSLPAGQPKKQKSASAAKPKLPVCQFGPKCYRKNPAHFQEYSHPWKDEAGTVGDNDSGDEILERPQQPPAAAHQAAKPSVSFSAQTLASSPVPPRPPAKPTPAAPAASKPPAPARPAVARDDDDDILDDAPPASAQTIIAKPGASLMLRMDSDDEDDTNKAKNLDQALKDNVSKLKQTVAVQSPKKEKAAPKVFSPGDRTLAFPALAMGTFTPPAKAIEIALEVIGAFLKKAERDKNLQLVLVEPNESLLKEIKQKSTIKDPRFIIRGGDITKLNNTGQPCKFIANPTNWRFKNCGAGINKLIHEAAGPLLYEETKKRFQTAAVGGAYAVPLPSASPLHKLNGVDWVVHVLPPSMDKTKPDAITDPDEAGAALRKAYATMFETFYKLASS